jgi:transketolase
MRDEYQALMEKQLNEWRVQTERFKAEAERLQTQARTQYDENLQVLHAKQAQAWQHFRDLKAANETAWEQIKTHMDKAGSEVKSALEQVTTMFKH